MKKWFAVLLACILVSVCACACAVTVQSFESFANGLATFKTSDKLNFLYWQVYHGDERLLDVFEEYAAMIEKEAHFDQLGSLKPNDPIIRKLYWYDYTGKEKIYPNTMATKDINWRAEFDFHIRCSKNEDVYIVAVYRSEGIDMKDLGKRTTVGTKKPVVKPTPKPTPKPTAKPTNKPVQSCDVCGGTRKCPECGGDNWVTRWKYVYVKGSPESVQVTELCDGRWCLGGACLKCHDD